MGTLENIQGEEIQPLDGKKIIEQIERNKNTPDKPTTPLLPQDQKRISQQTQFESAGG